MDVTGLLDLTTNNQPKKRFILFLIKDYPGDINGDGDLVRVPWFTSIEPIRLKDTAKFLWNTKHIPFAGIVYSAGENTDGHPPEGSKYIWKLAGKHFESSARLVNPGDDVQEFVQELYQMDKQSSLAIQEELEIRQRLNKTKVGKLYESQLEDAIKGFRKIARLSPIDKAEKNRLKGKLKDWKNCRWPESDTLSK